MLGYVISEGRGTADRYLAEVVHRLHAEGVAVAGAVQVNSDQSDLQRCDMDLHVIGPGRIVRISQNLGALSKGCRLDPAGLEQAVGLVEATLDATDRPRLLVVNKFGKQEIEGRGFRPVIGRALTEGIAVLTAVNTASLAGFRAFAEGMEQEVPLDIAAILDWSRRAAG
ncbi:MAG: 3-dehydroquinate dehydratase [Rhodobacterales bacterium 32-67-9]|nr:MAG: 3-dehydroquinate dehydratase [Rhodobacterales bacterium 32-67-9]